MFEWVWPWVFGLMPLPLLVRWLLPAKKQGTQQFALKVPFFAQLQNLPEPLPHQLGQNQSRLPLVFATIIWLALLAALARPQWLGDPIALPLSGRDLIMAIDVSGSMETPDLTWNGQQSDRLTAVKAIGVEFIEQRQGDRLGLIVFGSGAYLQSPLTYDLKTVRTFLQESVIGLAGERTAIGDAIGLAVKQFQDKPSHKRVLILLTDGSNNAGAVKPRQAADMAALNDLQIYTIGVGANSLRVNTLLGGHTINPSADLDEPMLREIASKTGGKYFRATSSANLSEIYDRINQLEPIETEAETYRPVVSLYYWPLGLALAISLLLVGYFFPWTSLTLPLSLKKAKPS